MKWNKPLLDTVKLPDGGLGRVKGEVLPRDSADLPGPEKGK